MAVRLKIRLNRQMLGIVDRSMADDEKLSELRRQLESLADGGAGFGDPDAARYFELELRTRLAMREAELQNRTAAKLNQLTLLLVVFAALNVLVLAVQVWRNA